jgi:hypothetical protein
MISKSNLESLYFIESLLLDTYPASSNKTVYLQPEPLYIGTILKWAIILKKHIKILYYYYRTNSRFMTRKLFNKNNLFIIYIKKII